MGHGRLKLRESQERTAELIFYDRLDEGAARWSNFCTAPVCDPESTNALLAAALGVRGTVRKHRRAFIWNECRIHLDEVEALGSFLEFEVLSSGNDADDPARMTVLVEAFGVDVNRALPGSYLDLVHPRL